MTGARVLLEFLLGEGRRLWYAIPRVEEFAGVRLALELEGADYLGIPMYGPRRVKVGYHLYSSVRPRPCGAFEPIEIGPQTATRAISVNVELAGLAQSVVSEGWSAIAGLFGLDPSSRSKLHAGGPETDELAEFLSPPRTVSPGD
jgi:hypothetical protein